jgi:hypothetical protein
LLITFNLTFKDIYLQMYNNRLDGNSIKFIWTKFNCKYVNINKICNQFTSFEAVALKVLVLGLTKLNLESLNNGCLV